ncbi:hypothetical protein [Solirubrobacter soli]|uniref:hypothetical protein n=1 Tax=Solirubrobacter soli TaxID=363832 RepID=UPI000488548C|nr:hypothetical protein [Solirubrobacter soli]
MLCLPASAHAQGGLLLDGTPLNVFADGLGAIQVSQDGVSSGLFYDPSDPTTQPAHAGIEIKEGDANYPLQDGFSTAPGRTNVEPLTITANGAARTMHTAYQVGPNIRVGEDYTYTDGTAQVDVHYAITNVSAAPTSIRVGALADLYVGNNDSGNGVIAPSPPRFVGGRDELSGLVYGLQEVTPWSAFQEGDFELVFDNFAAGGLNNTVDSAAPDNGVGATWQLDNLAPGETRGIDVRWLLASPAPPGTVSPPAANQADSNGVVHASPGGILPPPQPGKTINISLRSGTVCYTPPKTKKCIKLTEPVQIPVGSVIDTTKGQINLISAADKGGGVQNAWFYSGIFKVGQLSDQTTVLTLAGPKLSCPKGKKASASAKKPKSRKLWGNGKGKFQTKGNFSSATVRGTRWVVIDRCDGTLTQVKEGTVLVRDFKARKNVVVRAGKQYLARKK